MIQYLKSRNRSIHLSLEEAIDLQEKLAKSIASMYRAEGKYHFTEIIKMPMVLDNGSKIQQASCLTFVLESK